MLWVAGKRGVSGVNFIRRLRLDGLMDLKAGMTLNSQLEGFENAGFTEFVLDMSGVSFKTPEFAAMLREIQRRVYQKGKLAIFLY
jgi:hypothetical protein